MLVGTEPQLRWKTFSRQIVELASTLDAGMVVTLGALLAEVAHSRPVSVVGTTSDPEIAEDLGLRPSSYQGPTGIVGVLHDECRLAGLSSASLWAAVPAYVPSSPSPKAALALVERCAALLSLAVDTTELEIATSSYERQVSELVDADEETAAYVAELEQRIDDDPVDRAGRRHRAHRGGRALPQASVARRLASTGRVVCATRPSASPARPSAPMSVSFAAPPGGSAAVSPNGRTDRFLQFDEGLAQIAGQARPGRGAARGRR